MTLAPWLCLLCDSVPTHKKHAHMLHLSFAAERQKEGVIILKKKIVLFKVLVFRQVKRIQVTHLALIFETAK